MTCLLIWREGARLVEGLGESGETGMGTWGASLAYTAHGLPGSCAHVMAAQLKQWVVVHSALLTATGPAVLE